MYTQTRIPTSTFSEYPAQCVSRAELHVQAACVGRGGGSSARLITSPLIFKHGMWWQQLPAIYSEVNYGKRDDWNDVKAKNRIQVYFWIAF